MPTISTLVVAVKADLKQFQAGMAEAEAQTVGATNSMGSSISKFGSMATVGAGIAAIALVKFGEEAIQVAAAHEQTLAQLQLQVGGTTTAFETQAAALEKLTGFQHDEILAADTVLTRLKLTTPQIQALVPHILDFAAALGISVPDAAATFEKALLGTARGLKVGGIAFKDTGTQAGNYSELIQLASQATISGSASLDTQAKKVRELQSRWKDFQEVVGTQLLPMLERMESVLVSLATHTLPSASDASGVLHDAVNEMLIGLGQANTATQQMANTLGLASVTLKMSSSDIHGWAAAITAGTLTLSDLQKKLLAAGFAEESVAKILDAVSAASDKATKTLDELKSAHDAARAAAEKQRTAEQSLAGGLLGLAADAKSVSDAQDVVNRMKRQGKTDTDKYHEAVLAELNATLQVKNDLRDYANTLKDAGASNEDAKQKLIAMGRQFGLTKQDVLDALGATKQFTQGLKNMAAAAHGSGAAVMDGFVNGMLGRESAVRAAVQHLGQIALDKLNSTLGTNSPSTITEKMGEDVVQGLIDGLKAREKDVQKVFDGIQGKLENLTSRASDFRSAISGGFGSLLDLSNIPEGGDIASFVAESAASAKQWGAVLNALQRQGLSGPLLSQIAGMGPQALGMAQQLLQIGPAQIAAINQQYQAILKVQDHVSKSLTEKYFGDKIDQLREIFGDVRETLHHIANRIDNLSGHASGGIATRPTLGVFGERGPEALVPLGSGKLGSDVIVNINGPILGTDVGRVVRDELLKVKSRNGSTGL